MITKTARQMTTVAANSRAPLNLRGDLPDAVCAAITVLQLLHRHRSRLKQAVVTFSHFPDAYPNQSAQFHGAGYTPGRIHQRFSQFLPPQAQHQFALSPCLQAGTSNKRVNCKKIRSKISACTQYNNNSTLHETSGASKEKYDKLRGSYLFPGRGRLQTPCISFIADSVSFWLKLFPVRNAVRSGLISGANFIFARRLVR